MTTRYAFALISGLSLVVGCGGGNSKADDVYRVDAARACFENAGFETSVTRISPNRDVRRLRVFEAGQVGGPAYVTMIVAAHASDARRYLQKPDDEIRGNIVLRGPGGSDDAVTQCLLEAKVAG
jgi:hypothetical protein